MWLMLRLWTMMSGDPDPISQNAIAMPSSVVAKRISRGPMVTILEATGLRDLPPHRRSGVPAYEALPTRARSCCWAVAWSATSTAGAYASAPRPASMAGLTIPWVIATSSELSSVS